MVERAIEPTTRKSNPFQQMLVCYCNGISLENLVGASSITFCFITISMERRMPKQKGAQDILEKVTIDVLKLKEFDAAIFRAKVDHIDVQ